MRRGAQASTFRGVFAAAALLACGCAADADDRAADASSSKDAATSDAGSSMGACTITDSVARCDSKTVESVMGRSVYWAAPSGAAPKRGRPTVIVFQGSLYGPSRSWNVDLPLDTPFGGYYQVALIAQLVAHGFIVVQPEASGGLVWNTNSGGNYDSSSDAAFIPELLAKLEDGTFGPVDMTRLYATGISSGGYMTSRMAVSYPGKFLALAIQSASYATCLGSLCNVPSPLPADHPPTLLLHGAQDTTVPIATARAYYDQLVADGIEAEFVEDQAAGHQWLDVAPEKITAWFEGH